MKWHLDFHFSWRKATIFIHAATVEKNTPLLWIEFWLSEIFLTFIPPSSRIYFPKSEIHFFPVNSLLTPPVVPHLLLLVCFIAEGFSAHHSRTSRCVHSVCSLQYNEKQTRKETEQKCRRMHEKNTNQAIFNCHWIIVIHCIICSRRVHKPASFYVRNCSYSDSQHVLLI